MSVQQRQVVGAIPPRGDLFLRGSIVDATVWAMFSPGETTKKALSKRFVRMLHSIPRWYRWCGVIVSANSKGRSASVFFELDPAGFAANQERNEDPSAAPAAAVTFGADRIGWRGSDARAAAEAVVAVGRFY